MMRFTNVEVLDMINSKPEPQGCKTLPWVQMTDEHYYLAVDPLQYVKIKDFVQLENPKGRAASCGLTAMQYATTTPMDLESWVDLTNKDGWWNAAHLAKMARYYGLNVMILTPNQFIIIKSYDCDLF